ncbi:hypothetical protein RJT34_33064 [Clitoria ternatea]|uniref:Uncharacterized protein n=1 Tax=Clitoria ternatea TaxID=43366 RepID=A0AAN9EYL9_CLITE
MEVLCGEEIHRFAWRKGCICPEIKTPFSKFEERCNLGSLQNLQFLLLSGSKLSGTIPTEVKTLPKLLELKLSGSN